MPFPSQHRLQSREHFKGSRWHPQDRGQLSRDCAVHPITMLGTGEVPNPTLFPQTANLDSTRGR